MRFLAAGDFAEQILANRLRDKAAPAPNHDGNKPGQNQRQQRDDADGRA